MLEIILVHDTGHNSMNKIDKVPALIKLTSSEEDGYKSNNSRLKDSVLNRAVLEKGKFLNEYIAHGEQGWGRVSL